MDKLRYTITPTQGQVSSLEFTIIQSLGWEREPILDESNTTYLYTRVRGSVILSYAPAAASFSPNGNLFSVPNPLPFSQQQGPDQTNMPVSTDMAIRRFMEQPRGQITVLSNGIIWLQSPGKFQGVINKSDARNGPFTKVHSVMQIQGERLWKIHFEFETYINEYPTAYGSLPPTIISNRWYAIDDINWQHLRTRIYQGICTVRADNIQNLAVANTRFIDSLRNSFAGFTVPVGFQREKVHVTVTPDGLSAHYTVVDTEQLFNKSTNCPAVRIEIADTSWMSTPPKVNAVASAFTTLTSPSFVQGLQIGGWNFLGNQQQSAQAGQFMASAIREALSRVYRNVLVRAWGNQTTNRINLLQFALAVAQTRIGRPALFDVGTSEILVTQDTNNFVQVNITVRWGADLAFDLVGPTFGGGLTLLDQVLTGGQVIGAGGRTFANSLLANPDTAASGPTSSVVVQSGLTRNPIFPGDNQTRGTAFTTNPGLQTLVTQTLEGFDILPAAPSTLPV